MFIRIEPSSAVPIYRQIIDQIRYQTAAGILKKGSRIPSVRELASQLAVNQNTILKVYNELSREGILRIDRGEGTFVAVENPDFSTTEKKKIIAGPLREAAVLAIQFVLPVEEICEILKEEHGKICDEKDNQSCGRGANDV